jgi:hypothetical protein
LRFWLAGGSWRDLQLVMNWFQQAVPAVASSGSGSSGGGSSCDGEVLVVATAAQAGGAFLLVGSSCCFISGCFGSGGSSGAVGGEMFRRWRIPGGARFQRCLVVAVMAVGGAWPAPWQRWSKPVWLAVNAVERERQRLPT